MHREINDRNILDSFCEEFCAIVEKHCKYIIVSGFIAIASGRTRGTEDIDMIIEKLDPKKFTQLFEDLSRDFQCMQSDKVDEVLEYLQNNTSVRFTKKNKLLPEMEIKFSKDMLDEKQLNDRVKLPLTGLNVWFSTINMNVAFKEGLLKSDKDLEDARHLRIVFSEKIDEDEINEIKRLIKEYRL
jgi:hypothetical protein